MNNVIYPPSLSKKDRKILIKAIKHLKKSDKYLLKLENRNEITGYVSGLTNIGLIAYMVENIYCLKTIQDN